MRISPTLMRAFSKMDLAAKCLMVIEDNDASRRMVVEILRGAGFLKIIAVASAEQALDQLRAHNPDLILLDWELPGLSGVALAKTIRQAAQLPDARIVNPKLPMIMLTVRQRECDVVESRNAGVDEFVIKPYSVTSLLKAVVSCLVCQREFIVCETYIGPDRRRNKKKPYQGLLRRQDDVEAIALPIAQEMTQKSLHLELVSIKTLLKARGGLHQATLDFMVRQAMKAERSALDVRLDLIAEATQSLQKYMDMVGQNADPEVLDVHLDTLIALNEIDRNERQEAARLVKNLELLLKKQERLLARQAKEKRLNSHEANSELKRAS